MDLNISPLKELMILGMGPIFQYLAYMVLARIFPNKLELIKVYHLGILYFNLLPIYPLDGGKLMALALETIFPYRKSLKIGIYISYLIVLVIVLKNNISLINIGVMVLFLMFIISKENKKIKYYYERFLLERYLKDYNFKKEKKISNERSFYRNKNHQIKVGKKYETEKEFLRKKYNKFPKSY